MTAKEMWSRALELLDEPESTEYDEYALTMLNAIQRELVNLGIGFDVRKPAPPEIAAMDEELSISEPEAGSVMLYGVTALLSTNADKNLTNYFESKYAEAKVAAMQNSQSREKMIDDVYSDGGAAFWLS